MNQFEGMSPGRIALRLSRVLIVLAMVFGPFLIGNSEALNSPIYRILVCLMLLGCARTYYDLEKLISTKVKTGILLAALVWNNYYQLGKIGEHLEANNVYERFLFIIVGTVGMAEYLKRQKATRNQTEKQRLPPSQSSASPAAPTPAAQARG
jgi:hypothetical protein